MITVISFFIALICDLKLNFLFTVNSYLFQLPIHVNTHELGIADNMASFALQGQLARGRRKSILKRNLTVVRSVGNHLLGN